jgi:hypothetical protein
VGTREGTIESVATGYIDLPFTGTQEQRRYKMQGNTGKLLVDPTFGDLWIKCGDASVNASDTVWDYHWAAGRDAPVFTSRGQDYISFYSDANWRVHIHEVE